MNCSFTSFINIYTLYGSMRANVTPLSSVGYRYPVSSGVDSVELVSLTTVEGGPARLLDRSESGKDDMFPRCTAREDDRELS